jgi:hypothetical protein
MTGLLLALALAAAAPPPLALDGDPAARIAWTRGFASAGDDWINDIVPLGGGRFLAVGFLGRGGAGSDWRALAASFDDDGTVHAAREYGTGRGIDAFWSAASAGDGLVFAGFTDRIGAGGIDAFVLRASAAGEAVNERTFGGPGYDRFTDLAPAAGGFVFIGHSQRAGEDKRRLLAVRMRGDGVAWERIFEGPESISPLYVEPAADGGFVVAGGIGDDMLVMKLDGEGRELWRRAVGTPGAADVNHGLAVLANGTIAVVGYSRSWGARDYDILAATLTPSGEVIRRVMIGGAGDDRPSLARADPQGRVWIVGSTTSAGGGGADALVVRLDASGRFEPGALVLGTPAEERGTAIAPLADGSALVAGYSNAAGAGGEDAFVARIAAPGFAVPHPAFERREIP